MKIEQPVNIYTILSFIIAYHKKEQAHAEKPQHRRFLLSKHPLHIIHNRLSIHTTPTSTQRQLSIHSNYLTQTPGQFQPSGAF